MTVVSCKAGKPQVNTDSDSDSDKYTSLLSLSVITGVSIGILSLLLSVLINVYYNKSSPSSVINIYSTITVYNQQEDNIIMEPLSQADPTSYSRPDLHIIKNIRLTWNVNFDSKILSGVAVLEIERLDEKSDVLELDVSKLVISKISIGDQTLQFKTSQHIEEIGSKLTINLPSGLPKSYEVTIKYDTDPEASALQWLDASMTQGKRQPYMFSQCQAIHARSILPCQDTPAVKMTYTAEVVVKSEFTALMSAIRQDVKTINGGTQKSYQFLQSVPIPAYLIAIAVGDLDSRKISDRTTVWAEKELVDACAYEFGETEKMLSTAEQICGEYIWGIYDLLVLPPSFAFGGMENPCLTFVTPTLLAGDRSLADVIVHEITHSWTGNLVTNRNFEHFWLNEGWTMFVERKISSRLHGESTKDPKFRDFSSILGLAELKDTVEGHLGKDNPLTSLVVNLKGINPDDAFSTVPYEKGHTFLRYLENLVGGPDEFEPFLRHYLETFKRKSIDTDDFKKLFLAYFKNKKAISEIDWENWLHKPGMPLIIPEYDTSMSKACTDLAERWGSASTYESFNVNDVKVFNPLQKRQFLAQLLNQNLTLEAVKIMDKLYDFTGNRNSEIRFRWLRLCIKAEWMEKLGSAFQFVNEQGRMKFVRPIYRDLYAWEEVRRQTIDNFNANKQNYMHVLEYVLKKDLKL